MSRQDLRSTYPFHAPGALHNVRAGVTCCKPRKLPRRSLVRRLLDAVRRMFA